MKAEKQLTSMATETNLITYDKCCRTCLKEDSLMFDLFLERLESSNIADMLVSSTKLKILRNDSLPKQICRYCYNLLISFSHFCNMAQKAEEKLSGAMLNSRLNQNITEGEGSLFVIKIENNDHDNTFDDCEESRDNFDVNKNLETHSNVSHDDCDFMKVKTGNTKLNCVELKKQFNTLSKLKHENHLFNNKTICELCVKQSINCSNASHLTINETDSDLNLKIELNNADLTCIEEKVNTNIDQFQCDKCLLTFKNNNSLSAHMRKHTEKGRVLSCKVCNKIFKKISHLKRHEIQHEINRPYKCNVCPKSFPTEEALQEHVDKHRGVKPHGCPVCGKKFSHLSTLTTHIKTHRRDKSFLCPTCGKKFDTSTNLNQHMLRHIGLKEFACTLCPKKFVSKGELKSHTISHTGERSCTCDQCGATFTKSSSLTKHKLRHLGLKPYQCDTCQMRFTCKDHLKRHHRIHTGEKPYKCDICERAFTQSNDLVKHRRSHLGDKVYKCPQCSEGFRLNAELRQHISEHFVLQSMQVIAVSKEPLTDGVSSKDLTVTKPQPQTASANPSH